jgi:hypothetical protein
MIAANKTLIEKIANQPDVLYLWNIGGPGAISANDQGKQNYLNIGLIILVITCFSIVGLVLILRMKKKKAS